MRLEVSAAARREEVQRPSGRSDGNAGRSGAAQDGG
jgi:hypothetical protein